LKTGEKTDPGNQIVPPEERKTLDRNNQMKNENSHSNKLAYKRHTLKGMKILKGWTKEVGGGKFWGE